MGNCCGNGEDKRVATRTYPRELQTIFSEFDSNGDGKLTQLEFIEACKRCGLAASTMEVNAMFTAADSDRDEMISLAEFEKLIKGSPALTNLQRAFHEFDPDGSGAITEEEMRNVIRGLGQNLSDSEMRSMFRQADLNGDGHISFEEFSQMMRRHPLILNLREVFRKFDADNDGYITIEELRVVINQLSVGASERELKTMFQAADKNTDGRISFEEFSSMMSKRNF